MTCTTLEDECRSSLTRNSCGTGEVPAETVFYSMTRTLTTEHVRVLTDPGSRQVDAAEACDLQLR